MKNTQTKFIVTILILSLLVPFAGLCQKQQQVYASGFSSADARKYIKRKVIRCNGKIFIRLISKYRYTTDVTATIKFYNGSRLVDYDYGTVQNLQTNHTAYIELYKTDQKYTKTKISFKFEEQNFTYVTPMADSIVLEADKIGNSHIMLQVKNGTTLNCDIIHISVLFYNKKGKIVDIKNITMECNAKSTAVEKCTFPYSTKTYETLKFKKFKAIVSTAAAYQ